jgi:hypothetical protein
MTRAHQRRRATEVIPVLLDRALDLVVEIIVAVAFDMLDQNLPQHAGVQRLQGIQLGRASAIPRLEAGSPVFRFLDRRSGQLILDALPLRESNRFQPDIQINTGLLGEEIDFYGSGNRHVAAGRIKIANVRDANRLTAGDGTIDQIFAGCGRDFADEGRDIDPVFEPELQQDLVRGALFDPDFEVIALAKAWLINQPSAWQVIRRRVVIPAEVKLNNRSMVDFNFRADIVIAIEIDDRFRIAAINDDFRRDQIEIARIADGTAQAGEAIDAVDVGRIVNLQDRRLL